MKNERNLKSEIIHISSYHIYSTLAKSSEPICEEIFTNYNILNSQHMVSSKINVK